MGGGGRGVLIVINKPEISVSFIIILSTIRPFEHAQDNKL